MSWLSALPVIGSLFESVGTAIDKNVTSDEERLKLKAELMTLYSPVLQAVIEAQKSNNEMQVKIAEIEVRSEHWLVWARRPIISILAFLNLPVAGFTGYMTVDGALYLAMLVNGLDMGTRGLEKVVDRLKSKEVL